MELIVTRHGETVDNVNGIIQGQLPGKLTDKGFEQARKLAADLSQENTFHAIYSSDLKRSMDTAHFIFNLIPELPFYATTKLREKSFGIYEGTRGTSIDWETYQGGSNYFRAMPGGESFYDVCTRVKEFVNSTLTRHHSQRIIAVTHGGPMRVLKSMLEQERLNSLVHEKIPNCAVWRYVIEEEVEIHPSIFE